MKNKEVSFPSADGSFQIHGSLKLPSFSSKNQAKPVPAVLILNGSGPIDRHGNVKMPGFLMSLGNMNLNTSNMLSDYLANKQGMAALIYDKRGISKSISKKDPNLYYKAGVSDLVGDAIQAYRFLLHQSSEDIDINHIFLIGHSEGAILLPLILEKLTEEKDTSKIPLPKGLIFLCGFGECIRDVAEYQRETLVEEVKEQKGLKGWLLRRVLTKERLERQYNETFIKINQNPKLDYISSHFGLVKQPAKWLREHLALEDLRPQLSKVDQHCLAIAGANDRQVRSKFCQQNVASELVPNAPSVETHILPGMTHILRSMDGTCHLLDASAEYPRLAKLPLESELLSIVGKWCRRQSLEQESEV